MPSRKERKKARKRLTKKKEKGSKFSLQMDDRLAKFVAAWLRYRQHLEEQFPETIGDDGRFTCSHLQTLEQIVESLW